ncbi:CD1375 family protein [Brevibacillus agri]
MVKAGRWELDQVSAHLREEVQAMLDADSSAG